MPNTGILVTRCKNSVGFEILNMFFFFEEKNSGGSILGRKIFVGLFLDQ